MQAFFNNPQKGVYNLGMPGGRPTNKERTFLGSRIAGSRELAGLSQRELAERLGIGRNLIAQWERSAVTLKPDQLTALADTFGITVDELLGRSSAKRAKGPAGRALKTFERVARLPRRQQERVLATVEDLLLAQQAKKVS
jgi:transcriptional regulator with XRE-family HTH domain